MYSVIAPLRGEARVVDQLLSAIERLDYPPEKLDVILVVEADDHDTRAAITARKHRFHINVIPVPPTHPGTKPKALNVALEFARGVFTVVYDAEDRPEPNQLRRALTAFYCNGSELACVQARLCMDSRASWHARYFTAEYAGHFDIFLSKLAMLRLPLPLGGSSNHFRTETLRQVGGWDPYNVTEDADLGMRLARFGYRCDVIDSTTYEEAPTKLGDWLRQRARWFKGWMQTWLVHMRQPVQLFRALGPRGFLTFQIVVGGNAMVALVHPIFVKTMALEFIALIFGAYDLANVIRIAYFSAIVAAGYSFSVYLGWRGLSYRKVPKKFRVLAYTPAHWMLLSCAAWWAAFELVYAPFRWNKTEHGLEMTNLLVKLNQHLNDLVKRGELPQIWGDADARDSAASRQRPLLAAV